MVYLFQRNNVRSAGEQALTRLGDKEVALLTSASSVAVSLRYAGGEREKQAMHSPACCSQSESPHSRKTGATLHYPPKGEKKGGHLLRR
jgi:hypothetical protein